MGVDRVFLIAQSGDKGASRSRFLTHGTPEWSLFGFTKQFLDGKFCELRLWWAFSEVRIRPRHKPRDP
jgi:hypothetical protein